jgi:transposase
MLSERNAQIVAAWNAGEKCREIGPRFGITGARVCQIVQAAADKGIPVAHHSRTAHLGNVSPEARKAAAKKRSETLLARSADIRQSVIDLRAAGVGPRKIARWLGITPGQVAGFLHRAGLTERKGYSDEVKARAISIAAASTGREAAKVCGVSEMAVSRWRRQAEAA